MATKLPNDLPETSEVFGDKGDFWFKYDSLADETDKVVLERLRENIDVLLIFAGLFSTVNTAFIVLTLASLSAPPSYQTNALLMLVVMNTNSSTLTPNDLHPSFSPSTAAVRQNCMFFASLCSSILAAAGAVLAKQWLQSYERTGQTGTRQKQAMLRTVKWVGAETWYLRLVVEALPTLLLISLALFFAALCDLLWFTSKPVAIVVIVFTGIGAVFYGFTVIAAAINMFCPYQTAVSRVIRKAAIKCGRVSKKLLEKILLALRAITSDSGRSLTSPGSLIGWKGCDGASTTEKYKRKRDAQDEILCAKAVCWMLEHSTEEAEIIACAENIPSLSGLRSTQIIGRHPSFSTLVLRFQAALVVVSQNVTKEVDITTAFILGKAIAHAIIADPIHCGEILVPILDREQIRRLEGREETRDLWTLCIAFWYLKGTAFEYPMIVHGTTEVLRYAQGFTFLALPSILKLSPFGGCVGLVDLSNSYDDALLSLMYLEITDIATGAQRPVNQRVKDVWEARNGKALVRYLERSLQAHDQRLEKGRDHRSLLDWHTQVLWQHRFSPSGFIMSSATITPLLVQHLERVLQHCPTPPDGNHLPPPAMDQNWQHRLGGWDDHLDVWESRLERDPLLDLQRLQPELMVYATELLLCFGGPALSGRCQPYTQDEIYSIVRGFVKLEDRIKDDGDITHALKVVHDILPDTHGLPFDSTFHVSLIRSVLPIFDRALSSTSNGVVADAYRLLSRISKTSWAWVDNPRCNPPLIIGVELGPAVLRSLSQDSERKAALEEKPDNAECWNPEGVQDLVCWLAASIRSEPLIAPSLDESAVISLFVSDPVGLFRGAERYNYKWSVAYLFLSRWYKTLRAESFSDVEDHPWEPAMCDDVLKTLAAYASTQLVHSPPQPSNWEVFTLFFAFAQHAFRLRSAAALSFGLDRASDALIGEVKIWERGKNNFSDAETQVWSTMTQELEKAQRAYPSVVLAEDESLQYTNGTGTLTFPDAGAHKIDEATSYGTGVP
ncbi:hypothetical protein FRB96_008058 [Tulasnella sp. 330]|nr:hypothetical protein FRB96_008058 [Tulasnella sp. 330]